MKHSGESIMLWDKSWSHDLRDLEKLVEMDKHYYDKLKDPRETPTQTDWKLKK